MILAIDKQALSPVYRADVDDAIRGAKRVARRWDECKLLITLEYTGPEEHSGRVFVVVLRAHELRRHGRTVYRDWSHATAFDNHPRFEVFREL